MSVPVIFANLTGEIPLSNLDENFSTPITIGNTALTLGGSIPSLPPTSGGTGLTAVGASGNVLTSNGTSWVSSPATGGGGGGTVTSVGGGGTVNGITLSGVVTTAGSLTLSGTLSGVSLTTQVAGTLPVANGGTGVTTSTGTGSNVLSTSPTLVTPILGTPSSGTLTSCTGLPLTTGVTGTLPIANGGTNSTATPTAGGVGYGTGTAHAYSAVGTSGNALISAGASAPAFGNLALGTANTNVSGALTATNGGTGVAGTLTGILYGNGTSAHSVATAAQMLTGMGVANTTTSGYLSSTDWNTFNGKQPSGSYVTVNGALGTPSSGTLTSCTGLPLTTGVTGTLPIANGGTGQTTAALAINALVPTQTLNAGKVLSTNGAVVSWVAAGGSGTVTSASVVSANGFSGTVATPTTTPAITLGTSITGILKGNGTAISAATAGTDYSAGTSALTTGIVKSTTTTGALSIAVAADFPVLNQNTTGTASNVTGTIAVANGGTGVTTSTGTGSNVLSTSPTLVTPILGTPSSGTLTSCTGLPLTTGVTGTLPIANGGTGLTTTPANGALDIGNGTGFTRTTLTAGTGISITNAAGSISIAASGTAGVSTFSGGTTGLTPTLATTGAITLGGTLAVANGGTGVTTSTGTGSTVLSTSPTLVTPILGTPASGNFSTGTFTWPTFNQSTTGNAATASAVPYTGLTGTVPTWNQNTTGTAAGLSATLAVLSGGTGVTTSTGTGSSVLSTSPTLVTPILGTPSSGTLTSCTGLPISTGVSGLATGVATFLATPSSANLLSALTDETGTGLNVFATSPTLVTPILGTPTSGTLTSCTGLPLTTGVTGTLPIANGGTGVTTTPVAGQIDIGNGTGFTRSTLTAGAGVSITNAAGSITISSSSSFFTYKASGGNDTTGINTQLTAISTAGGGTLYLPAGAFTVSGALNVPANCRIFGDGQGATVITASHNGKVFNCTNNFFQIEDLAVIGPKNAAYTASYGIYTTSTGANANPTGALTFLLKNLLIESCYDGIHTIGSALASLENIVSQKNYGNGVYGSGAQGSWYWVTCNFNYLHGISLISYLSGVGYLGGASPFMLNIQTFANGQYGIYIGPDYAIMLTSAFLNNDSKGEIYFDTNTKTTCGNISNVVIQYAGINPLDTTHTGVYAGNANAAGIWLNTGSNNCYLTITNLNTFSNAGCDIKASSGVKLSNALLVGCGNGLPAITGYAAVPASSTDVYAFKGTGNYNIVSGCHVGGQFYFSGSYNVISTCWISNNSSTVPTIDITSTSINNNITNCTLYNNVSAGIGFRSAAGSSYVISSVNVLSGSVSANGTKQTPTFV